MKKVIVFFLFVLCLCSVLANPPVAATTNTVPEINYNSPATYNDASFWANPKFDQIKWGHVTNQGIIPAEHIDKIPIDVIKIEQIGDENIKKITINQWKHEGNLDLAGDLSQYENARDAVAVKHGFTGMDLSKGQTTYKDGVITNGEEKINLKDEKYKGQIIKALAEGGFSFGKGTSEGKLEHEGKKYDFEETSEPVEVKTPEESVLPDKAKMETEKGDKVSSLGKDTKVDTSQDGLEVDGVAVVDLASAGATALVGSLVSGGITPGSITLGEHDVNLDMASLTVDEGTLSTLGVKMTGPLTVIDKDLVDIGVALVSQDDVQPVLLDKVEDKFIRLVEESSLSKKEKKIAKPLVVAGMDAAAEGRINQGALAKAGIAALGQMGLTELRTAGGAVLNSVAAFTPDGVVPISVLEGVIVNPNPLNPGVAYGTSVDDVDLAISADTKEAIFGLKKNGVSLKIVQPYATKAPLVELDVMTSSGRFKSYCKGFRCGLGFMGNDWSVLANGDPVKKVGKIESVVDISEKARIAASVEVVPLQKMRALVAGLTVEATF